MKNIFDQSGFTLVETLVSVLIFSLMAGGFFIILSGGQSTWHVTDISIRIQQDLRQALSRVTKELHESGFDHNGTCQVTLLDGAGFNSSDILRFKVPVDWDNDSDFLDINSYIEWGAPTLWANKDPNCEGPNNNCQYLGYSIQYEINDQLQFIRKVLDTSGTVIRTDIMAEHITDFQVSRNSNIVTLQITSQRNTVFGRSLFASLSAEVLLRNRG